MAMINLILFCKQLSIEMNSLLFFLLFVIVKKMYLSNLSWLCNLNITYFFNVVRWQWLISYFVWTSINKNEFTAVFYLFMRRNYVLFMYCVLNLSWLCNLNMVVRKATYVFVNQLWSWTSMWVTVVYTNL